MTRTTKTLLVAALATPVIAAAPAAARSSKPKKAPVEGQEFRFSPKGPKYVTCDVEFRDPDGAMWPMFFYGRPSRDGSYTFRAQSPSASFSFTCDKMCQPNGDQSRKVLGELAGPGEPPTVSFEAKSMGPFQTKTREYKDRKGRTKKKSYEYSMMKGVLTVRGKRIDIEGEATCKYRYDRNATKPSSVYIEATFMVAKHDLGLRTAAVPEELRVRIGTSAYAQK